ncbi:cell division protein ZapD [Bordetella hinzii]|uniref:Cell division protein ZapD n=2 Tax=Bordetella hinzii TaxID=103855 RepID=A0AAN1VG51_9BORD|nr:cell division protein ZapD [Bordetella hinzii]AKQ57443.1 Cell division protein ZapD [Bordetella hinzii]AKQ61909.1 Cell division protein ZapD [Bordetella hinzii]AZW17158.1 cell division protein ZapD [Bordetella hinzii]KCB22929.1 PF07072 family protein [Bordetella hinzii OH87 BAL007II]KCB27060.1 PF07072 family protein [Bordetella hinzii L60]
MILYEYPFNERIRAYLRLEYLFDRLAFFAREGDARQHQVAVTSLFDILDACERTDMKGAVLQDLERQRMTLNGLRDHPSVDPHALDAMLRELERVFGALSVVGKTGQGLRENEWLGSLRGRLAVPGGATQVDMPSYYAWQNKPEAVRVADLQNWMQPFQPLQEGLGLALRLLREAGRRNDALAEQGAYQQMLGGKTFQLLRVWVDPETGCFPEISANKYMVWIRFSTQDGDLKPQQVGRDIGFKMSLCAS